MIAEIKSMLKKVLPHKMYEIIYATRCVVRNLKVNPNPDPLASVILSGSGRSGTTWIADIINYKMDYRSMFEPFHPHNVSVWQIFKPKIYFSPKRNDNSYKRVLRIILTGNIRDSWIDKYDKHGTKTIYRKRLLKCIFGNLLLKGIYLLYPGMPIILLLRHPCAVVSSQLEIDGNWGCLSEYFAQEDLVRDFLLPFKKAAQNVHNRFEELVFIWCIQNYVPLKQFERDEIHLIFYENFCKYPNQEIERLFKFLGQQYDDRVIEKIKTSSKTSWRKDSAALTSDHLINSWRERVTKKQLKRTIEIMDFFGLDKIYSENSMPNSKGAFAI
ncbi:MAG: sulfotransferase domain-containing protein [Planctomycetes bacterium]|nr:sulfotransferase domain-containing protein [Planctomycetota bacterium]